MAWISAPKVVADIDTAILGLVRAGILTQQFPAHVVAQIVRAPLLPNDFEVLRSVCPDMSATAVPDQLPRSALSHCLDLGFLIDRSGVLQALSAHDEDLLRGMWQAYRTQNQPEASKLLNSYLHSAIEVSNLAAIRLFLSEGADPLARSDNGWSILHFIVYHASDTIESVLGLFDPETVSSLLDSPNAEGEPPAFFAASKTRGKAVTVLVGKLGASVYNSDRSASVLSFLLNGLNRELRVSFDPETVRSLPKSLIEAVVPGGPPLLSLLLQRGFAQLDKLLRVRTDWDLTVRDPSSGTSLLTYLAERGLFECFPAINDYVVAHGRQFAPAWLPIMLSCTVSPADAGLWRLLLLFKRPDSASAGEAQLDVNNSEHSPSRHTALHAAAATRSSMGIQAVLALNPIISLLDMKGRTPLVVFMSCLLHASTEHAVQVPTELISRTKAAGMLNHVDDTLKSAFDYSFAARQETFSAGRNERSDISLCCLALIEAGCSCTAAQSQEILNWKAKYDQIVLERHTSPFPPGLLSPSPALNFSELQATAAPKLGHVRAQPETPDTEKLFRLRQDHVRSGRLGGVDEWGRPTRPPIPSPDPSARPFSFDFGLPIGFGTQPPPPAKEPASESESTPEALSFYPSTSSSSTNPN